MKESTEYVSSSLGKSVSKPILPDDPGPTTNIKNFYYDGGPPPGGTSQHFCNPKSPVNSNNSPTHSRNSSEDSCIEADQLFGRRIVPHHSAQKRPLENSFLFDGVSAADNRSIESQITAIGNNWKKPFGESGSTTTSNKTASKNKNDNESTTSTTKKQGQSEFENCSRTVAFFSVFCYAVLLVYGFFRDALRRLRIEKINKSVELLRQKEFPILYNSFDRSYTDNIYGRVRDCFNRPICSAPGATMSLIERTTDDYGWNFRRTGRQKEVINFGSYNYLGFAQGDGVCSETSRKAIREYGVTSSASPQQFGNQKIHQRLERTVAGFVGAEDAVCFPMGFATNSTNIAALAGKGSLILSDELNHASLIVGCKLSSGATKRVFKHNDMKDLERKLRDAIIQGHPKYRRAFTKILIIVEGIYSMEGSIVNLPKIIELKKKYNAYLWLDEAHSIGAMGRHGGGVVEYWGCDPRDVDVLMGTFTKSFGSAGGYIAGTRVTRLVFSFKTCGRLPGSDAPAARTSPTPFDWLDKSGSSCWGGGSDRSALGRGEVFFRSEKSSEHPARFMENDFF